ncbi:MAG: methylphosphotriester-DNA--protein-cysteine methyltransferase family protein [Terriglobus roseus]|nr:methylphosphotriester-DNA--protein-cysteine methyltransferase family protein [Terriglobus roseus]
MTTRNRDADGHFVYSVKSTGIYCRPTCAARLARRANVDFYRTPREAEAAGFRACKRCRPEVEGPEHDVQDETVRAACDVIARYARDGAPAAGEEAEEAEGDAGSSGSGRPAARSLGLKELAQRVGKTPRYLHKIFKDRMGVTPKQYAEQMRELYHPTPTSLLSAGVSASDIPNATMPGTEVPFDFNAFDLDFELASGMPLESLEQLDVGQNLFDASLSDMLTNEAFSPDRSGTTPLTPKAGMAEFATADSNCESQPTLDFLGGSPSIVQDGKGMAWSEMMPLKPLVDKYRLDDLAFDVEPLGLGLDWSFSPTSMMSW